MNERIGILASGDRQSGGGGSTAEKVVKDVLEQRVAFEIGVVICNNPPGTVGVHDKINNLNREFGLGCENQITVATIDHADFPKQPGDPDRGLRLRESSRYKEVLEDYGVDFVWMLGYMLIANGELVEARGWKPEYGYGDPTHNGIYHPNATLGNNHPAILPHTADTHGLGAHAKATELYKLGKIECTAMTYHLVSEGVDTGPVIHEIPAVIYPRDDAESLGGTVQALEKYHTAEVIERHLLLRRQHLLNSDA
jgi:folate-dependent phosphoribosylglycinamide formyltransferase PurN